MLRTSARRKSLPPPLFAHEGGRMTGLWSSSAGGRAGIKLCSLGAVYFLGPFMKVLRGITAMMKAGEYV